MMMWINVITCCEERSLKKRGPIYSEGHIVCDSGGSASQTINKYTSVSVCYRRFIGFIYRCSLFFLDDGTTQNAQRQASIDTVCTL